MQKFDDPDDINGYDAVTFQRTTFDPKRKKKEEEEEKTDIRDEKLCLSQNLPNPVTFQ